VVTGAHLYAKEHQRRPRLQQQCKVRLHRQSLALLTDALGVECLGKGILCTT
jgi:hypothetical protein